MLNNKVVHLIASVFAFGIPFVVASHASFLEVAGVGAILNGLYLWGSSIVNPTIPVSKAVLGGYHG